MHIFILATAKSLSGGVRQALYLAEGFQEEGHTVYFVCYPDWEIMPILKERKINHVPLPKKLFDVEKTLRSLMPKNNEPAVLHAFHNKGVKIAAYLGTYWKLLKLPVACVAHRGVISRPGNPLPYLLPGIRAYLVNSKGCAESLPLLWRKSRCHLVNNSIPDSRLVPTRSKEEMRQLLNIPDGHKIVGNVCNDKPLKGAGQAIKAFALSREALGPAKLLVLGVTPAKWQHLCDELGVSDDVLLLPPDQHVANYMQLMDILVFPSLFIESQPNVIIEAMSMGVPVIAGDVAGIGEILPEDYLFNAKNEYEISAKLIKMMNSPELLKKTGQENASQRYKYSMETRLKTVMEHYRHALVEILPAEKARNLHLDHFG